MTTPLTRFCTGCLTAKPLGAFGRVGAYQRTCGVCRRGAAGASAAEPEAEFDQKIRPLKARAPRPRDLKGRECERCGFIPEHMGQLDLHHRDGHHDNNAPDNLGTLCANCHRAVHGGGLGFTLAEDYWRSLVEGTGRTPVIDGKIDWFYSETARGDRLVDRLPA